MKLLKISVLCLVMVLGLNANAFSQASEGNVMVNAFSGALIRDNSGGSGTNLDFMVGLETNFFIEDQFSFTLGYDYYFVDGGGEQQSVSVGTRIYATDYFYLRYKTNLSTRFNAVNDFMLGGGYDIYISDSWYVEPSVDYHLIQRGFGLRLGFGVLL